MVSKDSTHNSICMTKLFKPEKITLSNHPTLKEAWIQERIAEDPTILNLGDLVLKDKERLQPNAGRLDILLQDPDTNRRYEIEIQLGKTNESHIIRTIEYWDIERRRYPQYDHCAVIIAEEITARFLNVISLFNGTIPLIAIQMNAYKFNEDIALMFTTVLDELPLGLVDDDEEVREITDRSYWIKRGTEQTVKMADELLATIKEFTTSVELKYNKFYIGLFENDQPNNFASFVPRKNGLNVGIRLPLTDETQKKIDEAGLVDIGYDKRNNIFRLRLAKDDLATHKVLLKELLQSSYENSK